MPNRSAVTQVEGDAALYALGALPSAEADKFRQRLAAGCPVCQEVLEECRSVVDLLPLAAPEVEPPPSIRARLMDRIGGDPSGSVPAQGVLVRADESEWKEAPAPG